MQGHKLAISVQILKLYCYEQTHSNVLSMLMMIGFFQMAFMAMRKNLDERARKKELDAIFSKFDRNHNGERVGKYYDAQIFLRENVHPRLHK